MVAYTFNSSTWEAKTGRCESKASLVYRVSSRRARATQRNLVSKKTKTKNSSLLGSGDTSLLISALERQRQVDLCLRGQPGLLSEFQDSKGYTEKPCLEITTTKQNSSLILVKSPVASYTKYLSAIFSPSCFHDSKSTFFLVKNHIQKHV